MTKSVKAPALVSSAAPKNTNKASTAKPSSTKPSTAAMPPVLEADAPVTAKSLREHAGAIRWHKSRLYSIGGHAPSKDRPNPDAEYTRITGWDRQTFVGRLSKQDWHHDYPSPAERQKHEAGEAAYLPAARKTPEYYFDEACKFAGEQYTREKVKAEAAAQLAESLAPRVIARGHECSLIPVHIAPDYFASVEDMFWAMGWLCEGSVVLTREAAPVLMQYLRVHLTLAASKQKMRQLHPFAWEGWGDDNAADWSKPQTLEDFAELFAAMLEHEDNDKMKQYWMESGLSLDDVIAVDHSVEQEEFTLTIVDGEVADDKPSTAEPEQAQD